METNKNIAKSIASAIVDSKLAHDSAAIEAKALEELNRLQPSLKPLDGNNRLELVIGALQVANKSNEIGTDLLNLLYQIRSMRRHINGDSYSEVSNTMFNIIQMEMDSLMDDYKHRNAV